MSASSSISLGNFLDAERERVDAALDRALERLIPIFPASLREVVTHGVRAGGKRIRPILCVCAFRAVRGGGSSSTDDDPRPVAEMYDLAISLELVHAYSLMHDDLPCMDDAPLRRGRRTPHTVHGEAATMVGAAALIPGAALQAWEAAGRLGLGEGRKREIVHVLSEAAGVYGMVGGQALDLLGEGLRLGRDDLDRLHGMKTGALLTGSLIVGALAAGAGAARRSALEAYGRAIGLAFQVADDLLDATSTAGQLGKNPSDAQLAKSTYVGLLGVEGARREAHRYADRAVAALAQGEIRSPRLEALARYVVHRDR